MNILVLHSSSDLYGAGKILLQSVRYLAGKGNRVVVVLSEEGILAEAFRAKGITVHILKLGILRRKYFKPSGLLNRARAIRNAGKALQRIIDEQQIDLVYSNTTGVLVGALAARAKKVRHLWHIHEIITQPGWFVKALGWIVNRYSDRVVVVSGAVRDYWKQYIDASRLQVVYNGIEYPPYLSADGTAVRHELHAAPEDIVVGMIGRVHYWKGQNYFLHIARHVLNMHPHVKFVMVGDAFPGYEYLYDELKRTKEELGITGEVTDLGYRRDIPQVLAAFDIFVLPSILPDPLPTVVLEAMASARPVVATAHGGALEMVERGRTGFHVPWDDAGRAAEAIIRLVEDKDLRIGMGKKGRERVLTHFSEDAYLNLLDQQLNITLNAIDG